MLTFLLRGGTLNVDERKAKGLWPNEKLRYSEVLEHLASVIQREEWFPQRMSDHKPGDLVYEGTIIQRLSSSLFVCHSRRASVYNLHSVAEDTQKQFDKAEDAAEFYLRWELNLPGRLDGWVVD